MKGHFDNDMDQGPKKYTVTGGLRQGSVLDPPVKRCFLHITTIIDFQYDLTIVLLAKQSKEVEAYTDETISFLKTWMEITLPSVS